VTDPRPTQAEVDAKAAEMFGDGWKGMAEREIQWWNQWIAKKLDKARAAVLRTR
jgi:hypothetical protein